METHRYHGRLPDSHHFCTFCTARKQDYSRSRPRRIPPAKPLWTFGCRALMAVFLVMKISHMSRAPILFHIRRLPYRHPQINIWQVRYRPLLFLLVLMLVLVPVLVLQLWRARIIMLALWATYLIHLFWICRPLCRRHLTSVRKIHSWIERVLPYRRIRHRPLLVGLLNMCPPISGYHSIKIGNVVRVRVGVGGRPKGDNRDTTHACVSLSQQSVTPPEGG